MTTLSLALVLAESARRTPHQLAVVEGEERVPYGELWRQARQHAAALQARGVGAGDRVALLAPNVADFVRAYFGILAAGGVVVPVPTLLNAEEAGYILRHSGAQLLLHNASFAAVATGAAQAAGVPAVEIGSLAAGGLDPVCVAAVREAEDTAVIFYTSGTTGRPKGALLSHLNLVMNATVNAFDGNPIRRDDVVMGCLPLFHTFGQTVSMNSTFRAGASLLLQLRFDPAAAIDLMHREGATLFFGVPTMYVQLLEAAPRAATLPQLRDCVSGGASLPVVVLERFEKAFATTVYEGYGLSETSPSASVNQPWFGTRPGTVGHPLWGVEIEVADETLPDRIVLRDRGKRGEVVIRGHNVFSGYLDDPGATADAVVDGWFRTGDIGTIDDDGFISIVDRTKDLIIRGGFNVYPREVEEVLARHPAVAQVAVIGVPDDELGEEVCAVIVPVPVSDPTGPGGPGGLDPEELVAWSRERLGRHKYPRRVEILDALPTGPSHKVLKRELRTRYAEDTPR